MADKPKTPETDMDRATRKSQDLCYGISFDAFKLANNKAAVKKIKESLGLEYLPNDEIRLESECLDRNYKHELERLSKKAQKPPRER